MFSIKLKPTPCLHYDIHIAIHNHLEYLGCIKLLSLAPQWMHLSLMSAIL